MVPSNDVTLIPCYVTKLTGSDVETAIEKNTHTGRQQGDVISPIFLFHDEK
jgi:hypothetical protein